MKKIPSYGTNDLYLEDKGEQYFGQQRHTGLLSAKFNKPFFSSYISAEDDVLDFGCGGGFLLNALKANAKIGVEINPAARRCAEELGVTTFSSLSELEERTFSRIISSHALEHVPNPYQALIEIRTHLRSDGIFIWLSPLDDWRAKWNRTWQENDSDMHLYTWTPKLIGNLLYSAGFMPQSIKIVSHAFPPFLAEQLWNVNSTLFRLASHFTAVLRKSRQILVVSSKRPSEELK